MNRNDDVKLKNLFTFSIYSLISKTCMKSILFYEEYYTCDTKTNFGKTF